MHDRARQAEDTDWPQILALYDLLDQLTANPVVTLNRAIATAMVSGPVDGLALLATVDQQLAGHHRLDATRAYLPEMAGDTAAALTNYRAAAKSSTNLLEQRYLTTTAGQLNQRVQIVRDG